jgi:hypothetical protein
VFFDHQGIEAQDHHPSGKQVDLMHRHQWNPPSPLGARQCTHIACQERRISLVALASSRGDERDRQVAVQSRKQRGLSGLARPEKQDALAAVQVPQELEFDRPRVVNSGRHKLNRLYYS